MHHRRWRYHHDPEFRRRHNAERLRSYHKNSEKERAYRRAYWKRTYVQKVRIPKPPKIKVLRIRKDPILARLVVRQHARIMKACRSRVPRALVYELLGCSAAELKTHLESKFAPGMTWENWGTLGWHIDHIRPLERTSLSDLPRLRELCHYSNLQPIWAKDHVEKNKRENLLRGLEY